MRIKLFLLSILTLSIIETAYGKETNKTKLNNNYKQGTIIAKGTARTKRSVYVVNDKPFGLFSAKDKHTLNPNNFNEIGDGYKIDSDEPFWGTRGRRDSSSSEYNNDRDYPVMYGETKFYNDRMNCQKPHYNNFNDLKVQYTKNRRDESDIAFWGNRGRRNSEEMEYPKNFVLGSNKDNKDDPFWGTRGRRMEGDDSPFWGARGRRQNPTEAQPQSPFWGNRGRRDDSDPFWGNRGRRDDAPPFWGNRGRRQESIHDKPMGFKEILRTAISLVENKIEKLSRKRRNPNSNWNNGRRNNQIKPYFSGSKYKIPKLLASFGFREKPTEYSTILNERIFAEQPSYLLFKAARDRRGAIEDLVKSVRNDPFYIARGKKDNNRHPNTNSTNSNEDLSKVKELICSTIDLITVKNEEKVKRDVTDNDRDRRTILKKLAAQLQMDPYFVSRGKKSEGLNEDTLEEFIKEIAEKCQ